MEESQEWWIGASAFRTGGRGLSSSLFASQASMVVDQTYLLLVASIVDVWFLTVSRDEVEVERYVGFFLYL